MYGSCWTCGGAHFSRDCPKAQGKGGYKGDSNREIRVLSSIAQAPSKSARDGASSPEVTKRSVHPQPTKTEQRTHLTETRNRYEVLSDIEESTHEEGGPPPAATQEMVQPWSTVTRKRRPKKETLGSFIEVARESISSVEEDTWQEVEMAVDSGATETVVGTDMLTHIATREETLADEESNTK